MKKILSLFVAVLATLTLNAALPYGTPMTEAIYNSSKVGSAGENVWDGDNGFRCGGSGVLSPAWDWDDKYADFEIAAGVPKQVSFFYRGNTTASTFVEYYVSESANGQDWNKIWSVTSNTVSFAANPITLDLSKNTRYLRFCFHGNFAGYFKDITVTERIEMGTATPATIDFGTVKVDDEVSPRTVSIPWTNLVATASSTDEHFSSENFGSTGYGQYDKTATPAVTLATNEAGSYSGTITWEGRDKSASVTVSATVEKYTQSINDWNPTLLISDQESIPTTTATSGLDVTYTFEPEGIVTFENNAFTILAPGVVTITAAQEGNYKYLPASSASKTITIWQYTTYGEDSLTTCPGFTAEYNGSEYAVGTHQVTIPNAMGGDSVVTLKVGEYPSYSIPTLHAMRVGESYQWEGQTYQYDEVGYHSDVRHYSTIYGCDSTRTLKLNVYIPAPSYNEYSIAVCEGDVYTDEAFANLSETGDYSLTLEGANSIEGDSVITLHLTVNPTYNFEQTLSFHYGEAEPWREKDLSAYPVGTYTIYDSLTTVAGCDSVYALSLTVLKARPVYYEYAIELCADELPYSDENFTNLTEAGEHERIFENVTALGGDSVVTLQLIVHQVYNIDEEKMISSGQQVTWHNYDLSTFTPGAYLLYDSLTSQFGCDSVHSLSLLVQKAGTTYGEYQASTCKGVPYSDENFKNLTQSGQHRITLAGGNVHGGDSVITMFLTIHRNYELTETLTTTADRDAFVWHDQDWAIDGVGTYTFIDTLETLYGCDSVITLTLEVEKADQQLSWNLEEQALTAGDTILFVPATATSGWEVKYDYDKAMAEIFDLDELQYITFTEAGTVTITASQPGDETHFNAAQPITKTFEIAPAETGIEQIVLDAKDANARKVVVNGQIYIIRDNSIFDLIGNRLR